MKNKILLAAALVILGLPACTTKLRVEDVASQAEGLRALEHITHLGNQSLSLEEGLRYHQPHPFANKEFWSVGYSYPTGDTGKKQNLPLVLYPGGTGRIGDYDMMGQGYQFKMLSTGCPEVVWVDAKGEEHPAQVRFDSAFARCNTARN